MSILVKECSLGLGVIAARNFAKEEFILEFTGHIIPLRKVLAKGDKAGNPLQIGFDRYIDLEPPGVFVNHSCVPNAGIREDKMLVALQPIIAGEEICYDYSTTIGLEATPWTMQCLCGASRCRKIISDFYSLPKQLQKHYLDLGIVQRFIETSCAANR